MSAAASNFLKDLAFSKQHPEFAEEAKELHYASQHAASMYKAGKLTKSEFEDVEALLFQKTMEALPMDLWESMKADGSLEALQAVAGHDGTRDAGDVEDARKSVYGKIQADALDDAWLDGRISAEHYARESRNLEKSDVLDAKLDKGDHDGAAAEAFAARNDVSTHDADLSAFLDKQYGKERRGREETPEEKPAEKVTSDRRSVEYDDKKTIQENLSDYFGRPEHRQSAVDNNGIVDLEILEEQGEAA